jgi:hypothetical protein
MFWNFAFDTDDAFNVTLKLALTSFVVVGLLGGFRISPAYAQETEKITCLGIMEEFDGGTDHHLHWTRAEDDQDRKLRLDRHPQCSATCWAKIPDQLWKKVKPYCNTDGVCLITGEVIMKEDEGVGDYWKSITKIRKQ